MGEKIYKSMGFSGVIGITIGIVILCVGIVTGIMMIVSGGKLLSDRSDILI